MARMSKRMLEKAIMAILSSRRSVSSPRLDQIKANLENRLARKVPPDQSIGVLTSLETDGKVIRHYSATAIVTVERETPRKKVNPPVRVRALKITRSRMPMKAGLADDTTTDPGSNDDFNLQDGVRVVLCNQPQVPLLPGEVLQRLNDFFGITFSQDPVTDALEDLAALPEGDPKKIEKSSEDRFSRQCS